MQYLISCSIVLYKSPLSVKQTIEAVLDTSLPIKLFLIDNSPTDQLFYQLSELLKDERVAYIYNNENKGYGAGHNIAIRKALDESEYHLVLNPDVTFQRGVLEKIVDYLNKNKDIGLLIPKVVLPTGELQYVCKLLPTPLDLISRRFFPDSFTKGRRNKFELRHTNYDQEFEAPYIHGCFMFLRTEALKKVGLFDERFFMYPEDIDLTRRIHREYKTMFYPHVTIVHQHQKGSYKSLALLFIHITNMIKYFNKWGWFFDKDRKKINKYILSQNLDNRPKNFLS